MSTVPGASAPRKLLLGLIGSGIQKSMTPAMQEQEAREQGLRLHYQLIDLDATGAGVDDLPQLLKAMRIIGFDGFNVTYPCKQAIIPLLDDLSEQARAMGAVNTVVNRGGKLVGHNTDGSGWAWGFQRALPQADLSNVVLLGGGGAGSAIADAALRIGVKRLTVVDLDAARTQALADKLNDQHGTGRVSASTDIAAALDGATRPDPCDPDRHGQVARPAVAGAIAAAVAVGVGDRLFPARDGVAEGGARARLPDLRRRRHGGRPGGRRVRTVHRPEGGAGAHRRAFSRHGGGQGRHGLMAGMGSGGCVNWRQRRRCRAGGSGFRSACS